jgi:hypothetical protein
MAPAVASCTRSQRLLARLLSAQAQRGRTRPGLRKYLAEQAVDAVARLRVALAQPCPAEMQSLVESWCSR